jgi:DNA polymerase I-like protein with 3'-5' exonuclease and polymerase domains
MYLASPGHILIQADYMQAEAVVVSYESMDTVMIDMFERSFGMTKKEKKENKCDIHTLTASRNFEIPYEEVTKELRSIGKMLRHATNYSAGPKVLSLALDVPMNKAKELLQLHHKKNPQLGMWHRLVQEECKRNGQSLTNLLGRQHKFLSRWGDQLFRSMYSYIPQSTVADLLNKALVEFYKVYGNLYTIYLQLHDAIYVLCPDDRESIKTCVTAMRECMIDRVQPLKTSRGKEFYIDVDFSIGYSWGEMNEVEYKDILNDTFEMPAKIQIWDGSKHDTKTE